MKPATMQTLQAWQVQRARLRRLETEEAVPVPWWARHCREEIALLLAAEVAILCWIGGMFR